MAFTGYGLRLVDLSRLGDVADEPTIGRRGDGRALAYAGRVNGLSGPLGSGKSWMAGAVGAQVLEDGGAFAWVDGEDSPGTFAGRMRALGVPDAVLHDRARVRYLAMVGPLEPEDVSGLVRWVAATSRDVPRDALPVQESADPERGWSDESHDDDAARWRRDLALAEWCDATPVTVPVLVVIDSVSAATAISGLRENENDDYTAWHGRCPAPIAGAGAAVLNIDQVVKDPEGARRGSRGANAKGHLPDGVIYSLQAKRGFSRGSEPGHASLVVVKDRPGHVGPVGSTAARVTYHGDRDTMRVTFTAPQRTTTPDAVRTLAELLDTLGLPREAGRDRARRALREHDHSVSNDVLAAALTYRKTCPPLHGQVPEPHDGQHNGQVPEPHSHNDGQVPGQVRTGHESNPGQCPPPKGGQVRRTDPDDLTLHRLTTALDATTITETPR